MFSRIDRRAVIELSEFVTLIITSWNGTTAQARLRPVACPARFDIYGLTAGVSGGWSEAIEALDLDFAYFRDASAESRAAIEVELEQREPDWDAFGETDAAYVTEQHAVYRLNGRTVVDHLEA